MMWVKGAAALLLGVALSAQGAMPPAQRDPLGLAGSWIEYWPGLPLHDITIVTYQEGQYGVRAVNPQTGEYRVDNVRVEGQTLKFTEHPGNAAIQYEVQVRDNLTCAAQRQGGPKGAASATWRRAGAGPLGVSLRWDTQGTDVDLFLIDPQGERCRVVEDVTNGPGQEVCPIPIPAAGEYRIEAVYTESRGDTTTPLTVEVRSAGKAEGPFLGVVKRQGERVVVQTLQVPPAPGPVLPPPGQPGLPPPEGKDPLGLVGLWDEYWPGVRTHDFTAVYYQGGQYSVRVMNPHSGEWLIENVRLEGDTLRFTEYAGTNKLLYSARVRDADTCSVTAAGPVRGGENITWRRHGTGPPPTNAPAEAGPGDLVVTMRWETAGADIDLFVTGPRGQRCSVEEDITNGPGAEVCLVRDATPGEYRMEALYAGGGGGAVTPVIVEVQYGPGPRETYRATVQRPGERALAHTFRVPGVAPATFPAPAALPAPTPAAAPGDLVISLRWETPGTDVDLHVTGPNGRQFPPIRDVTTGPGEEVCIVRNPAPGEYRIEAMCFAAPGNQAIPVTAQVQFGGRQEAPVQGTLPRRGARALIHTFRVPGVAAGPTPEAVPFVARRPAPGAPGNLVVTMRWETRGTDVDLYVTDPNGRRCPVVQDVTNGPGEETCTVRNPLRGDYRIEAVYCDSAGNQATPVTAEVQFAGRREGPFRATVQRDGDRMPIHTVRVGGGAGAAPQGPDLTIRMRWETQGTDIDLYVFDPDGQRCPVLNDVTQGPGEETCIVRNAAIGEYRIEAAYCGPAGGPPTPVTVQVDVGGKAEGPYRATVQRPGEQALVHTLALIPKGGAAQGPAFSLVVALRWETRGTDVDLVVIDPNGQRCNVLNDVTNGPGQETCIVRNPVPGDYRIEALYADTGGGQATPVTAEVQLGGRALGTYQATLRRPDERVLVHTVQVPARPQGAAPSPSVPTAAAPAEPRAGDGLFRRTPQQPDPGAVVPGSSLMVMLQWETRGTDVDLVVLNPRGQRCPPFNDVTRGPGRETVVVRQPLPGDYRIEAHYFSDQGGQTTPVTVEVRRDGRLEGVYQATLQRRGEQIVVHSVRF